MREHDLIIGETPRGAFVRFLGGEHNLLNARSVPAQSVGFLNIDKPWRAWLCATNPPDPWTRFLLAASATTPPLVTDAVITASSRSLSAKLNRPLHGNNAWSTDPEMRSSGIRHRGMLF